MNDTSLRLIVTYKLGKAAIQLAAAATLLVLLGIGLADRIHALTVAFHEHATEAWSLALSTWLLREATPHHERVAVLALGGDGLLSALEGYCLHRRYRWAAWMVAGLMAVALPVEIVRVLHQPRLGRFVLLLMNAIVVAWLAGHAREMSRRIGTGPQVR